MNGIDSWIKRIGDTPIPVLGETIKELRVLCQEETVSIPDLTDIVSRDPGLTVQILRNANRRKRSSLSAEVTTVNQALMMMGTEQLSKLPDQLPNMEESLGPAPRKHLLKIFARAYHAGQQATDWAIQRRDMTPDEVFAAAELHFLAEMLFAIVAPEKLRAINELRYGKSIASHEAQYVVLGFTFNQFTRALAREWKLPSLVIEALHDSNAQFPRAYGIMLAVQIAHSGFIDWHNERTLGIYQQVADWLGFDQGDVVARSHRLAVKIADKSEIYQVRPAAALLPLIPKASPTTVVDESIGLLNQPASAIQMAHSYADVCLCPQYDVLKNAMQDLKQVGPGNSALDIIARTVRSMHDGGGFNRAVFAQYDKSLKVLKGIVIVGSNSDPRFNRFVIKLDSPHLFTRLMEKPQAIVINDATRDKFGSMIPKKFFDFINTNSFAAMSVFERYQPLGMFYVDRHTSSCQVDEKSYQYFKTLSAQCAKVLNSLERISLEEAG